MPAEWLTGGTGRTGPCHRRKRAPRVRQGPHLAVHCELEGVLRQRAQEEGGEAIVQDTGPTADLPGEESGHAALGHPGLRRRESV